MQFEDTTVDVDAQLDGIPAGDVGDYDIPSVYAALHTLDFDRADELVNLLAGGIGVEAAVTKITEAALTHVQAKDAPPKVSMGAALGLSTTTIVARMQQTSRSAAANQHPAITANDASNAGPSRLDQTDIASSAIAAHRHASRLESVTPAPFRPIAPIPRQVSDSGREQALDWIYRNAMEKKVDKVEWGNKFLSLSGLQSSDSSWTAGLATIKKNGKEVCPVCEISVQDLDASMIDKAMANRTVKAAKDVPAKEFKPKTPAILLDQMRRHIHTCKLAEITSQTGPAIVASFGQDALCPLCVGEEIEGRDDESEDDGDELPSLVPDGEDDQDGDEDSIPITPAPLQANTRPAPSGKASTESRMVSLSTHGAGSNPDDAIIQVNDEDTDEDDAYQSDVEDYSKYRSRAKLVYSGLPSKNRTAPKIRSPSAWRAHLLNEHDEGSLCSCGEPKPSTFSLLQAHMSTQHNIWITSKHSKVATLDVKHLPPPILCLEDGQYHLDPREWEEHCRDVLYPPFAPKEVPVFYHSTTNTRAAPSDREIQALLLLRQKHAPGGSAIEDDRFRITSDNVRAKVVTKRGPCIVCVHREDLSFTDRMAGFEDISSQMRHMLVHTIQTWYLVKDDPTATLRCPDPGCAYAHVDLPLYLLWTHLSVDHSAFQVGLSKGSARVATSPADLEAQLILLNGKTGTTVGTSLGLVKNDAKEATTTPTKQQLEGAMVISNRAPMARAGYQEGKATRKHIKNFKARTKGKKRASDERSSDGDDSEEDEQMVAGPSSKRVGKRRMVIVSDSE